MSTLPEHVVGKIVQECDSETLVWACAHVCRLWRRVSQVVARNMVMATNGLPSAGDGAATATTTGRGYADPKDGWVQLLIELMACASLPAKQVAIVEWDSHIIFKDPYLAIHYSSTITDCFPVSSDREGYSRTILQPSPDWSELWWGPIEQLSSADLLPVPGYTGPCHGFCRGDVSCIFALNASHYLTSFEERATFGIFMLKDGRFTSVYEGTYVGSVDSRCEIRSLCRVSHSFAHLVTFGLSEVQRNILRLQPQPHSGAEEPNSFTFTSPSIRTSTRKVRPHFCWKEEEAHIEEDPSLFDKWLNNSITPTTLDPKQILFSSRNVIVTNKKKKNKRRGRGGRGSEQQQQELMVPTQTGDPIHDQGFLDNWNDCVGHMAFGYLRDPDENQGGEEEEDPEEEEHGDGCGDAEDE
ncbi:hypothetical protein Pelo_6099 [Pelomyxa schiedti]|nr:hypothetical protein Pelo_6099 [Pelomyxa schiedti]